MNEHLFDLSDSCKVAWVFPLWPLALAGCHEADRHALTHSTDRPLLPLVTEDNDLSQSRRAGHLDCKTCVRVGAPADMCVTNLVMCVFFATGVTGVSGLSCLCCLSFCCFVLGSDNNSCTCMTQWKNCRLISRYCVLSDLSLSVVQWLCGMWDLSKIRKNKPLIKSQRQWQKHTRRGGKTGLTRLLFQIWIDDGAPQVRL